MAKTRAKEVPDIAANSTSSAKSPPGQGILSPSAIQNKPKLVRRTPTKNLNQFSGTLVNGRWRIQHKPTTDKQAASAPELAAKSAFP